MSSHREAPEISKDPVADNTDVYAFVDPVDPTKVTLIANYIPFEEPAGGPNFFQFGDDVLYEIKIDNDGDARADLIYQFRFNTSITNPATFLYNTGPITSLTSPSWNLRQSYSVTRLVVGHNDEDDDDVRERRVLGAKASSSTSGRSSTSAPFARSETCTSFRCRRWPGKTGRRASTSTPSRCRSQRPSSRAGTLCQ